MLVITSKMTFIKSRNDLHIESHNKSYNSHDGGYDYLVSENNTAESTIQESCSNLN